MSAFKEANESVMSFYAEQKKARFDHLESFARRHVSSIGKENAFFNERIFEVRKKDYSFYAIIGELTGEVEYSYLAIQLDGDRDYRLIYEKEEAFGLFQVYSQCEPGNHLGILRKMCRVFFDSSNKDGLTYLGRFFGLLIEMEKEQNYLVVELNTDDPVTPYHVVYPNTTEEYGSLQISRSMSGKGEILWHYRDKAGDRLEWFEENRFREYPEDSITSEEARFMAHDFALENLKKLMIK